MNTSYVLYLGIIPYLAEGDIGTNLVDLRYRTVRAPLRTFLGLPSTALSDT